MVNYVTADEALKAVKPGERIYVHSNSAYPKTLIDALVRRKNELFDVEICHLMVLGDTPYMKPEMEGHFRHNAFFLGSNTRSCANEGKADFIPIFLSELPSLIRTDKKFRIDTALIHISPPDAHGFCSLGVAVEATKAAVESAGRVIAQVNPNMPVVHGDSFVHISSIDLMVQCNDALEELLPFHNRKSPGELSVYKTIGENIAALVEDGATLQMGIGAIPDAVLEALGGAKDLGIHTEMFSDGIIPLIENGIITCSKKTLLPGKIVASFLLGSKKLFDYVNNNPMIEMRPSDFVNDPFTIARNDKMTAINSALQVDLTGQVCADSIGHSFYSGIGGQVDFIRGAARSKGGKPIIALPSTAKEEKLSRIVPYLSPGAGVTTSRGDIHYVVTEYGTADLHGMNIRQRASALISIAHPKFKDELLEFAKKQKYI